MALLAEEIVEEWLRRAGYFTMRGVKLGVHEIDVLAVRHREGGVDCRHIEVQASIRPVSYISKVPKALQRQGRAANSAKRTDEELRQGVTEWVHKKFDMPEKRALMSRLWPGAWTRELVIHNVKADKEVELIRASGVTILKLSQLVSELKMNSGVVASASGGDFIELINLARGA